MKIIELRAENIKRLTTVEIRPSGNMVQITGKNGSGKTSVLDSILFALGGAKAIQSQPIRRGAKSATIRLDLGDLIVTRKFSEGTSTVNVESADGARFPSPQAMLDKLLGTIAFDPLAFARQKPREQFDTLRGLVQVDIDFDLLERQQQGDYARRQEINRDVKSLRARIEAFHSFAADLPAERIDTKALVDAIADAGKHNADIELRKERRVLTAETADSYDIDAKIYRARAVELRRQAHEQDEQAKKCEASAAELRAKLDTAPPLPEPVDVDHTKAELAKAEQVNAEVDRRARHDELQKQAWELDGQAEEITERMNGRDKAKRDAIAAAKMPVEGIAFGESQVMLNGVPFEQASDAEQLRASAAIAMASNPQLRVIRIRDGSLLDEQGLELLSSMADEKDFQCWIERVDSSGTVGIVMVDGRVKNQQPTEAEESHETV